MVSGIVHLHEDFIMLTCSDKNYENVKMAKAWNNTVKRKLVHRVTQLTWNWYVACLFLPLNMSADIQLRCICLLCTGYLLVSFIVIQNNNWEYNFACRLVRIKETALFTETAVLVLFLKRMKIFSTQYLLFSQSLAEKYW